MFKVPFSKFNFLKSRFLMVFLSAIIVGFFFLAAPADASVMTAIATFLGWIIYGIVWALGQLLVLMMWVLVQIAQYNTFINSPAVNLGWKIVRDICNMFFVVIMLVIAFATVLRVKDYSYDKLLPKLIIMAILINFSKLICGLIIDVAQVVMLTFVNSFKDVAGGNLTNILGLDKLLSMNTNSQAAANSGNTGAQDVSGWSILGAYILALIYVIIGLIVIVTMIVMLAIRIVMLWIYIVLSPMAYLLAAFPAGQKYSSQWWSEFTKNVIIGPVLAFFIWLSFASLGTGTTISPNPTPTNGIGSDASGGGDTSLTQAGSPNNMLNFIIGIAMLVGGLQIAQTIGGAAGGIAKQGMGAVNSGRAMAGTAALWAGKRTAIGTGRAAKSVAGGTDRFIGRGMDNLINRGKAPNDPTRTDFGKLGLMATAGGAIANAPKNAFSNIKKKISGDKKLNDALFDYSNQKATVGEGAAVMTYDGKKYKKIDDKFREVNDDGTEKDRGQDGNANVLRKGEKDVKEKNAWQASFHDSWRSAYGGVKAENDKKQADDITKRQQGFMDANYSNDELARRMNSSATSKADKMAMAMVLAVKGGFKDLQQVKDARKAFSDNLGMSKKFNDELDKTSAHVAYDFTDENDKKKFIERADEGKIDVTKMKAPAYENSDIQRTLQDYLGKNYSRTMESTYNSRGAKYEAPMEKGLLASKRIENGHLHEDDQSASLHAKLTGEMHKSFDVNGHFDVNAFTKHLESKNATAADLNKIKPADLDALFAAGGDAAKNAFLKNVDLGKLKGMKQLGTNGALVEKIVNLHLDTDANSETSRKIRSNDVLSGLMEPRFRNANQNNNQNNQPQDDDEEEVPHFND